MREILEAISTMMPMLIGLLGGFFLISGGDERVSGTVFWVFFGIAVSSLAVSIVELVKTLRDLPQKTDTADMKQKMNDIKAGVDSTNTILLDTVKPALQNVNEQTKKIDNIVTIMSRFDGYDERFELLKENESLKVELLQIRAENRQLRKEKQAIEKRYNTLLEQTHPDDELEFEM